MSEPRKTKSVKFGDENRAVVMRVPVEVAAAFRKLVPSGERGARSRMFSQLVEDAVAQEGELIDSAMFDAPKRREGGGLKAWDELNARLEGTDE